MMTDTTTPRTTDSTTPRTVVPYTAGAPVERATAWATLPPNERRRRAMTAAAAHDTDMLCALADAHLTLAGAAGATVSPHTRSSYQRGIVVLVAAWQAENLLHPRPDAARVWLRGMEAEGLTAATVRVRLAAARNLYGALRWAGATDAQPFTDARPARDHTAPKDKRGPYSPADLAALLAVVDETQRTASPAARARARYDRVLLFLGAHAGLRASEMMDLRWSDVDLVARNVVVQHGKGGKKRSIVMSASLAAALDAIPAESRGAYVLPYRRRGAAWARVKKLTTRAGIGYQGLHRLRHSAGTRMMLETHDLQEVAELLGHSQLDTARVYAQWANDTQRRTVSAW